MNYRHGFHAGNFADVLKHLALCELLRRLTAKKKKLFVLDTHAGAGGYDLTGVDASRTQEARAGIGRLIGAPRAGMPDAVARYVDSVAAYDRKFGASTGGCPRHYPGSPRLIRAALRAGDRLVACELNPQDALALKREFAGDRAVQVRHDDGYQAIKALLPPPERRGLVLIDPPFEASDEFAALARALHQGLRRFATGCYVVWYPIKEAAAAEGLVSGLAGQKTLQLELGIAPPAASDRLAACGLVVVNPPWKFDEAMAAALPWVAGRLGGTCSLTSRADPISSPTA